MQVLGVVGRSEGERYNVVGSRISGNSGGRIFGYGEITRNIFRHCNHEFVCLCGNSYVPFYHGARVMENKCSCALAVISNHGVVGNLVVVGSISLGIIVCNRVVHSSRFAFGIITLGSRNGEYRNVERSNVGIVFIVGYIAICALLFHGLEVVAFGPNAYVIAFRPFEFTDTGFTFVGVVRTAVDTAFHHTFVLTSF